jgi:hypothetical protein
MSEWTTIRNDIETDFEAGYDWLEGTPLAQALEAGYKKGVAEVKTLGPQLAATVVTGIATAATAALTGGTDVAIEAGAAAALPLLEQAGQTLTKSTLTALATGVVATLQPAATTAPTPSPAA